MSVLAGIVLGLAAFGALVACAVALRALVDGLAERNGFEDHELQNLRDEEGMP